MQIESKARYIVMSIAVSSHPTVPYLDIHASNRVETVVNRYAAAIFDQIEEIVWCKII